MYLNEKKAARFGLAAIALIIVATIGALAHADLGGAQGNQQFGAVQTTTITATGAVSAPSYTVPTGGGAVAQFIGPTDQPAALAGSPAASGTAPSVSVTGGAGTAANAIGGAASLVGGAGNGTAIGGAALVQAGISGTTDTTAAALTSVIGASANGTSGSGLIGGTVNVTGGVPITLGAGGVVNVKGGASIAGATGPGGQVNVTGGVAGSTNDAGGAVVIAGSPGAGTGAGGLTSLTAGASGAGATGNGGSASLVAGAALSTNGSGGNNSITAGAATGTGTGGNVALTAGAAAGSTGTPGAITMSVQGLSHRLEGVFFSASAVAGPLVSSSVQTSIVGAGVGTKTLPANFLVAGRTIRIHLGGTIGTQATAGNVTLAFFFGGSSVATSGTSALLGTTAITTPEFWAADVYMTCLTTGAGGTAMMQGMMTVQPSTTGTQPLVIGLASTSFAIDTTATKAIDVQWTWATSSATNQITTTCATYEALN